MANDKYGLTHLSIDELPTYTGAPASGDFEVMWDVSAQKWVKRDAATEDQTFDDITVDVLTVATITPASTTVTFTDGAYDYDIASHDGTNGLKLGGTLVSATAAELNYNDIASLGTGAASKAVVLDGSSNFTFPAAGTFTSPASHTVALSGTLTRSKASLTGTTAITQAAHANRVNVITGTAAATYTLPEATGTGNTYLFVFGQVNTNGTVFVTADTTNCSIGGSLNILDQDANAQTAYFATTGDDTITINGTTTGGLIGDTITLIDIATDQWAVYGSLVCPAGSNVADMFSSAA